MAKVRETGATQRYMGRLKTSQNVALRVIRTLKLFGASSPGTGTCRTEMHVRVKIEPEQKKNALALRTRRAPRAQRLLGDSDNILAIFHRLHLDLEHDASGVACSLVEWYEIQQLLVASWDTVKLRFFAA